MESLQNLPSASNRNRPFWIDRYLGSGNHKLSRLLRYALQDVVVAALGPLASRSGGRFGFRSRKWREIERAHEIRALRHQHNGFEYRVPADLSTAESVVPRRVILIGSCLAHRWLGFFREGATGCPCDFLISNFAGELPEDPPRPVADYDFQVVQIPIRSIIPEGALTRLSFDDVAGHEALFDEAKRRIAHILAANLQWNRKHALLSFVCNLLVPQQNAVGRTLPRYDLRNPAFFVEQLNLFLSQQLDQYQNAYYVDIDQIAATFGKKFIQNDQVVQTNHGGLLFNHGFPQDGQRLEPMPSVQEHYELAHDDFIRAVWAEILATYRTIRSSGAVKLVVVDLDDTLWRGVVAEEGDIGHHTGEGWPQGVIEALGFLKKRGILLAIISKNDRARIEELWPLIMEGRLSLDDFAAIRINWEPKAQNLREILQELALLPQNTVFVDDNPVERAGIAHAFPGVRTLGAYPLYLRRVLLWAPETQVLAITAESSRRTEMVRAQMQRNESSRRLDRSEFLKSLGLKVNLIEIRSIEHPRFARAYELINKTNQFNTTGRRWTKAECKAAFDEGWWFCAFEVEDRYTQYGLVGVLIVNGDCIEQFVMSCRVLGLDVELTGIEYVARRVREAGSKKLAAMLVETEANTPCRTVFGRAGFSQCDERWSKDLAGVDGAAESDDGKSELASAK